MELTTVIQGLKTLREGFLRVTKGLAIAPPAEEDGSVTGAQELSHLVDTGALLGHSLGPGWGLRGEIVIVRNTARRARQRPRLLLSACLSSGFYP